MHYILHASSIKLQLAYTSVIEEVKKTKAKSLVTMQQSQDQCIRNADINIDAGRKRKVSEAVENATSRLHHQEIAGISNIGREGIQKSDCRKSPRARRKRRYLKVASLQKQGVSTKWQVPEKKLTHREVILSTESKLQFMVKAVYDLLPTHMV